MSVLLPREATNGGLDGGLSRRPRDKTETKEGHRMALLVLGCPVCPILSLVTFSHDRWLLQLHVNRSASSYSGEQS